MPRSKIEREEYSRTLDGAGVVITSTAGALDVSANVTGGSITETNSAAILADTTAILADTTAVLADTTSIKNKLPSALGTQVIASSLAVNIASDQTLAVSGTVDLGATDNAVLDAIAASLSGSLSVSGTVDLGATDNAVLDAIASSLAGTLTVSGTISSGVCGTQGNASPAATLAGGGVYSYSSGVDTQFCAKISAYGSMTPDTEITVKLEQSQDNSNWYDCGVSYVSSGTTLQNFFMSLPDAGSRYYRLGFAESNASPTETTCIGTIAGKQ